MFCSKKSYLENRRRFLEKRRDNCGQSVKYLVKFNEDGTLSEDDDAESETTDKQVLEQQMELSSVEENERTVKSSDPRERTPPPYIPKPVLQMVNTQSMVDSSKDLRSKSIHLPSPPKVQRLIKPESQASPPRQKQSIVSQSIEVPLEQIVEGSSHGQQQYLQIVGSDGKTQLLQIVGNSTNQQVFELVPAPGQQPVLRPVSVQKQQERQVTQTPDYPQEAQVQYVNESSQGHVMISQSEPQEQIIITDASDEQVVQEQVVVTEGSQEQIVYSDVPHNQLIVSDSQTEHIIVSEGTREQVVVTGYPQEQVIEEVVMEETAPHVSHREVVVSSNHHQGIPRPALQSLLRKQPELRAKSGISVLKPQIQQQIASGVPVMIVTQGSASATSSQPQTIYSVPTSSQTAVVTASQQAPSTAVVIASVPETLQSDNIIETAFVTATQGESEAEAVEDNGNSRAIQVARQLQGIVQQQPQQQQIVVAHGQSGEMMNIDDIEVQPLQASQEDIMRTMESIASELLGVSSIDLAP